MNPQRPKIRPFTLILIGILIIILVAPVVIWAASRGVFASPASAFRDYAMAIKAQDCRAAFEGLSGYVLAAGSSQREFAKEREAEIARCERDPSAHELLGFGLPADAEKRNLEVVDVVTSSRGIDETVVKATVRVDAIESSQEYEMKFEDGRWRVYDLYFR